MHYKNGLLAVVLALACSSPTYPFALDGNWEEEFTIPGNSLEFTLTANGGAISGSGRWTGEACCSGTVTVTGDAPGSDVNLSFMFVATAGAPVPPRTSTFVGRATDSNTLSGRVVTNGYSSSTTFRRVK